MQGPPEGYGIEEGGFVAFAMDAIALEANTKDKLPNLDRSLYKPSMFVVNAFHIPVNRWRRRCATRNNETVEA
jgi:hypothetical protein